MSKDENVSTYNQNYIPGEHPNLPPPRLERGLVKWLRENLFNTWYNSIATAICLYLIYLMEQQYPLGF